MAAPPPPDPTDDILRDLTIPASQAPPPVLFHFAPGCVIHITLQPTPSSEAAGPLLRAP